MRQHVYTRDILLVLAASFFYMASPMLVTPLITGFTAKEAVVSTLSVLTGTATANLSRVLGSMFTGRSAASFLVFTLLYTPCVAAIAAVKREMGSGMRAFLVVVLQCAVAWLMAFAVYQIGGIFF